jgi:hypothetical protein
MTQSAIPALLLTLLFSAPVAAFAATDPAPAPTAASSAGPAPVAKSDPDQKMVCKNITSTGSRLGSHRVCMTKAQWVQQSNDARDTMNHQNPMSH